MNLCSKHDGDEVCFEGNECPACVLQDDRDEVEAERDDLKEQLDKANAELEDRANDTR